SLNFERIRPMDPVGKSLTMICLLTEAAFSGAGFKKNKPTPARRTTVMQIANRRPRFIRGTFRKSNCCDVNLAKWDRTSIKQGQDELLKHEQDVGDGF
ncbi:MAG TPA: hypothetical protein PKE58_22200, partial [Acidobacteriota bacterium]|nr:hypothetical protein [Acidobacteriota bacterium]